ncbi:CRAL-TRIO domain-containing protein [Aspergillus navahoensis]
MADQAKLPDQAQPAQAQDPDTTKLEQQPTATESASAPEPATTEPTAATTAQSAADGTTEAAPAAPEPAAAPAEAAAAPAPEPTKSEPQPEPEPEKKDEPEKPKYFTKTPALEQLFDRLPTILSNTGHQEMWGVPLKHDATDIPTINVLIKFLRANAGDLKAAEDQLSKALTWRKENDPIALADASKNSYDASKFKGLGYLTTYECEGKGDLIVTWNIYGAVKKFDETFGDITEFIKWRAALMELAVQELKLDQATSVIDYDGEDPYQMIQVHDYLNVSFFRMNPNVKAATKRTIDVFSTAYPELLREKFFVNVPAIMGWMFAVMKVFVNQNTARKFHPISNGANLAKEFPAGLAEKFPKPYGGAAPDLEGSARTVAFREVKKEEKKEEPKEDQKAE